MNTPIVLVYKYVAFKNIYDSSIMAVIAHDSQ